MGNRKQNVIGCKGCSKYSDLIVVQDPRSARLHDKLLKLDPGSPGSSKISSVRDPRYLGSYGNIAVTGSRIFRIPWESENARFKILQDPGSWILGIQNLGSFWDLGTCLLTGRVSLCPETRLKEIHGEGEWRLPTTVTWEQNRIVRRMLNPALIKGFCDAIDLHISVRMSATEPW